MFKLQLLIFLAGTCPEVFGKAGPSRSLLGLESGRDMSGTNGWYTESQYDRSLDSAQPLSASNKDSYAEAAAELGYSHGGNQLGTPAKEQSGGEEGQYGRPLGPPSVFKYQVQPSSVPYASSGLHGGHPDGSYGEETGLSYGSESSGWLCRTFGGLCETGASKGGDREGTAAIGLLGLLLLAVKKVKVLPFLPLLIPLLPILLPLLLIFLVPLLIASFFLPIVPVIVVGNGRMMPWARAAQDAFLGQDCIERITCEVSRVARGHGYDAPWIKAFLDKNSRHSQWIEKVSRAARSSRTECEEHTCSPIASLRKAFKQLKNRTQIKGRN